MTELTARKPITIPARWGKPAAVAVLAGVVFIALVAVTYSALPFHATFPDGSPQLGVDWKWGFRPASLAMLRGDSPYDGYGVFNPPWVFLLLSPLAALPESLGAAAMAVVTFAAFGLAAARLKAKPYVVAIFLLSPFIFNNARNGNIDWIVALGVTLPPQIGLFFVLAKPQIGLGIALFWLFEAWREGRLREVVRVFAPVSIAMGLSIIPYGLWMSHSTNLATLDPAWNGSLWPLSIPIGIALLVTALRSRNINPAIASSSFLTPYLAIHSWSIATLALLRDPVVLICVNVVLWVMRFFYIL